MIYDVDIIVDALDALDSRPRSQALAEKALAAITADDKIRGTLCLIQQNI
jgi:hypothetical protein